MSKHVIRKMMACGGVLAALAGCEDGPLSARDVDGDAPPTEAATVDEVGVQTSGASADEALEAPDGDVEAPEVFELTATALWDGRPSFGGTWVAYSNVMDPERVVMRNPSNGNVVIGALFRRERDFPGAQFQVSSDAAAALGMQAGQSIELRVTALRVQEPEGD